MNEPTLRGKCCECGHKQLLIKYPGRNIATCKMCEWEAPLEKHCVDFKSARRREMAWEIFVSDENQSAEGAFRTADAFILEEEAQEAERLKKLERERGEK